MELVDPRDTDNWRCLICQKIVRRRCRMKDHVESRHLGGGRIHACTFCGKLYSTKNSLQTHHAVYHKDRIASFNYP